MLSNAHGASRTCESKLKRIPWAICHSLDRFDDVSICSIIIRIDVSHLAPAHSSLASTISHRPVCSLIAVTHCFDARGKRSPRASADRPSRPVPRRRPRRPLPFSIGVAVWLSNGLAWSQSPWSAATHTNRGAHARFQTEPAEIARREEEAEWLLSSCSSVNESERAMHRLASEADLA
jgi:hypothetical protein